MSSHWLTAEDAAAQIGVSVNYVQRQCAAGVIKAKKLGAGWRISQAALDAFMGQEEAAPPARKRLSARQQRRAS